MLQNVNAFATLGRRGLMGLLILLGLFLQVYPALADDCDNWGRVVHVNRRADDDLCTLQAGASNGVTKQLEDPYDFDYFVFYLGYDAATPINEPYTVTLTETSLSRPKFVVGTFYDDPTLRNPGQRAEDAQKLSEFWYSRHGSSLGLTQTEFTNMVSLGPNLQHDGVYDYVDGNVVVVQESSDAATRLIFYAVPVGTNLATNTRGEHTLTFTPPDRGAYAIIVSNYSSSNRSGTRSGSYKLNVSRQ